MSCALTVMHLSCGSHTVWAILARTIGQPAPVVRTPLFPGSATPNCLTGNPHGWPRQLQMPVMRPVSRPTVGASPLVDAAKYDDLLCLDFIEHGVRKPRINALRTGGSTSRNIEGLSEIKVAIRRNPLRNRSSRPGTRSAYQSMIRRTSDSSSGRNRIGLELSSETGLQLLKGDCGIRIRLMLRLPSIHDCLLLRRQRKRLGARAERVPNLVHQPHSLWNR